MFSLRRTLFLSQFIELFHFRPIKVQVFRPGKAKGHCSITGLFLLALPANYVSLGKTSVVVP